MKIRPLSVLCLALPLGACQSVPSTAPAGPTAQTMVAPGQTFAEASCSACHAVGRYGSSSNSNAPPFAYIANTEGLTAETLRTWLSEAHNYPSEMAFYLNEGRVNELVAYMLTLRDPNYRRPPD